MDAPLELCRERILERAGLGAEHLAGAILDSSTELFERPTADEVAEYDAYKYIGVSAS